MTNQYERSEIEDLLPWHAAGTLTPREARDVEAALVRDPELMRRFMLAREELHATVELNESLGQPSPRAAARLFEAIDAESGRKPAASGGFAAWIGEFIASLTPRQLAFSAVAGALAIVLQAGLIGALVIGQRGQDSQQVASVDTDSDAFVRFSPGASASEIASLLEANRVSIVDGPRPGGLYRVRIAALPQDSSVQYRDIGQTPTPEEHRNQTLARLRAAADIVSYAVPAK
jgi:hypothetical protein